MKIGLIGGNSAINALLSRDGDNCEQPTKYFGEVAERPIVQHWKCCVRETGPRVRIPPSPLFYSRPVVSLKRLIFTLRSLKKSDAAAEAPQKNRGLEGLPDEIKIDCARRDQRTFDQIISNLR